MDEKKKKKEREAKVGVVVDEEQQHRGREAVTRIVSETCPQQHYWRKAVTRTLSPAFPQTTGKTSMAVKLTDNSNTQISKSFFFCALPSLGVNQVNEALTKNKTKQ